MPLMLMLGVFSLDNTDHWINSDEINTTTLQGYLSCAAQTQDQLSDADLLPSFEQLFGGWSLETVQEMGTNDVAPAIPRKGVPSTYTFTIQRENAALAQTAPNTPRPRICP